MQDNEFKNNSFYANHAKRWIDVVLCVIIFGLFWWLYLIVAIFVRIFHGSPVLFKQQRPGKNEKIFGLYKFRSMTNEKDKDGNLLPDDKRLTKFGKILRSTSLDEIPELFNVLKGDMSFIGPRPLLVRYLPFYTKREHHRHDVRPGITGLAQVSGRNYITWEETFDYDLQYVKELSFMTDVKILFMTVLKVLMRKDIADDTQGTQDSKGKKVHDALDKERSGKCESK